MLPEDIPGQYRNCLYQQKYNPDTFMSMYRIKKPIVTPVQKALVCLLMSQLEAKAPPHHPTPGFDHPVKPQSD